MFRARVWESYRIHNSSGYRYASLAEITEVPGRCTNVVYACTRTRSRVFLKWHIPVPRVLYHGRTELTEVPGTGMKLVPNLQAFRVRVPLGKIPRVWFCTYPTGHKLGKNQNHPAGWVVCCSLTVLAPRRFLFHQVLYL